MGRKHKLDNEDGSTPSEPRRKHLKTDELAEKPRKHKANKILQHLDSDEYEVWLVEKPTSVGCGSLSNINQLRFPDERKPTADMVVDSKAYSLRWSSVDCMPNSLVFIPSKQSTKLQAPSAEICGMLKIVPDVALENKQLYQEIEPENIRKELPVPPDNVELKQRSDPIGAAKQRKRRKDRIQH